MDPEHNPHAPNPRTSPGFILAIVVSAIAHLGLLYLAFFVLPNWLRPTAPPQAYTVKIVDAIPAGDLGTHLPHLSEDQKARPEKSQPEESTPGPATPAPPIEDDKNAIELHTAHTTPTPKPKLSPVPTKRPKATTTPTPKGERHRHAKPTPTPAVAVAKAASSPSVDQKLDKVRQQLMAEHLKHLKAEQTANEANGSKEAKAGGGPVTGPEASEGKGYGVGAGGGSQGILQDPAFLLYYQQVQKKIKDAWSFTGDNPELTATVTFGINPDGSLNAIKVSDSSRDPSFDDSVVRAIRRAAPFPPPPEKYRTQFWQGIQALFKLGELNS